MVVQYHGNIPQYRCFYPNSKFIYIKLQQNYSLNESKSYSIFVIINLQILCKQNVILMIITSYYVNFNCILYKINFKNNVFHKEIKRQLRMEINQTYHRFVFILHFHQNIIELDFSDNVKYAVLLLNHSLDHLNGAKSLSFDHIWQKGLSIE